MHTPLECQRSQARPKARNKRTTEKNTGFPADHVSRLRLFLFYPFASPCSVLGENTLVLSIRLALICLPLTPHAREAKPSYRSQVTQNTLHHGLQESQARGKDDWLQEKKQALALPTADRVAGMEKGKQRSGVGSTTCRHKAVTQEK